MDLLDLSPDFMVDFGDVDRVAAEMVGMSGG